MYQKPTVPRSIGGVLDDSLQLFKASLSRCILPAVAISVIATALSLFQLTRLPAAATPVAANLPAMLARYQNTSPSSLLLTLLSLLLELVFYGILIAIIVGVTRGAAPSFGTAVQTSLRRLPAMFGASVVFMIVGVVGFAIAVIPGLVAAVRARGAGGPAEVVAAVAPMLLVCLVLMLPVLYVLGRLQLFLVPLVSEPEGPLQSIGTSWRLVGGNWWRATTVVFILGVIIYILTIIVVAIAGTVAVLMVGTPTTPGTILSAAALVGALMGGLIRIFSVPLMASLYVTLYQDLKLRKGGGDLEARLGALPKG